MTGVFYPAGSRIGRFVIETVVSQDSGTVTYLGRDIHGGKAFVTVWSETPGAEVLQDIRLWMQCSHPGVIPVAELLTEPVPLIANTCVSALTVEDHIAVQKKLDDQTLLKIIRELLEIVTTLFSAGCRNWYLGPKNVFITSENQVQVSRLNSALPENISCEKYFCELLVTLCDIAGDDSAAAGFLRSRLERLSDYCTLAEISGVVFMYGQHNAAKTPMSRKGKIIFGLCGAVCLGVIGSIVGIGLRQSGEAPTVTEAKIEADYHSTGPKVHELEKTAVPEKKAAPVQAKRPEKSQPVKKNAVVKKAKKAEKAKRPAAIKKTVKNIQTPLVADAARRGNLIELRNLIAAGKDVNQRDRYGKSALQYAAAGDWDAMIKILVSAGASITPDVIASAGRSSTVKYLHSLQNQPRTLKKNITKKPSVISRSAVPRTTGWRKADRSYWHITLETAMISARRENKKIFVLFTGADWCPPCKMLEKNVLSSFDFRRLRKKMEVVFINIPRGTDSKFPRAQRIYNSQLQKKLKAGSAVPCAVILDRSGKTIGRIRGYRPKANYMRELRKIIR